MGFGLLLILTMLPVSVYTAHARDAQPLADTALRGRLLKRTETADC